MEKISLQFLGFPWLLGTRQTKAIFVWCGAQSMIRKSGHRFSEKIMLKSKEIERNDDSKNVITL